MFTGLFLSVYFSYITFFSFFLPISFNHFSLIVSSSPHSLFEYIHSSLFLPSHFICLSLCLPTLNVCLLALSTCLPACLFACLPYLPCLSVCFIVCLSLCFCLSLFHTHTGRWLRTNIFNYFHYMFKGENFA